MDDDHVCLTITVTTFNVHIFAVFVSWMLVCCLVVGCWLDVWLFVCLLLRFLRCFGFFVS